MRPQVTLRKALCDPHLLGNGLAGDTWNSWRTLLIAAMGEQLTDEERELFKRITGREHEPGSGSTSSWLWSAAAAASAERCPCSWPTSPASATTATLWSKARPASPSALRSTSSVASIVLEHCAAVLEQSPILRS